MKKVVSRWRDSNGNVKVIVGKGDTVAECKIAITEQMDDIESDPTNDIAFVECISAKVSNV